MKLPEISESILNNNINILLVEDEDSHAFLIRRLLENYNPSWSIHHVDCLLDASNWIEMNKDSPPSLVIADYLLPDGNGLNLAKGAQRPADVGFPLIILTGFGSEKIAVRALKSGAMEYVIKEAESLRNLPEVVERVLREWEVITEYDLAEEDLVNYIKKLEEVDYELEDLVEKISHDIEKSLATAQKFSDLLLEEYANILDDNGCEYLLEIKNSVHRTNMLIQTIFDRMLPLSFGISLVKLYSTKMEHVKDDKLKKLSKE
jgi:DNA-binding response OmpR family regulator